jgi:hypothetical protein
MKKFSDQERATIARGWAASGLPQDLYAASFGVTGRSLRGWMAKFAPSQPPVERVEAILVEMMERLQTVLEGVRAERAALEIRAEGRKSHSEPPSSTPTAAGEVFRQERQPERVPPPTQGLEPDAGPRPARPRRAGFFQDFGSE